MECRSLELTLISAEGLKKPRSSNKTDKVYVTVTLTGYNGSLRTPTDKKNPEPIWNHPMQITVDETAGQKKRMLVFKIKAVRTFFDKNLGEVRVSFKELMEGMKDEGKDVQVVTYKVNRVSKKPGGTITFSYKFGPKFIKPVTVYAHGTSGTSGTSSAYARSSSSGFGTGFLGGLVMADIISHAGHHGGGGGCGDGAGHHGGGGCGGGAGHHGGGGCGGGGGGCGGGGGGCGGGDGGGGGGCGGGGCGGGGCGG